MPCVSTLELDSVDVYDVQATTFTVTQPDPALPPTSVTVALDITQLQNAYNRSCLPAMVSYDDFELDVQTQTDAIATARYHELQNVNQVNAVQLRIAQVRVCLTIGWVQIYIIWHI